MPTVALNRDQAGRGKEKWMLQKLFGKKKAATPDAGTGEAGGEGDANANANAEENANALPVWKRFGKTSLMLMGGGAGPAAISCSHPAVTPRRVPGAAANPSCRRKWFITTCRM